MVPLSQNTLFQTRLPFLITPFPTDKILHDKQRESFNRDICGARAVVECGIGQLKSRFRSLKNGLRFRCISKCSKFIMVCCALHNFILKNSAEDTFHSDVTLSSISEVTEATQDDSENEEQVGSNHTGTALQTNERIFQKYYKKN